MQPNAGAMMSNVSGGSGSMMQSNMGTNMSGAGSDFKGLSKYE